MECKTALVILAEGAEEIEAVVPIDVLRRAGVKVTVAGLNGCDPVMCSRETVIVPNTSLLDVIDQKFDVVILPGGQPGSNTLASSELVSKVLHRHHSDGRYVAAICAAPIALNSHGIAKGCRVTSHPCVEKVLSEGGYEYCTDNVIVSENIVTSRGPGTAFDFALKLVDLLVGSDKVKAVAAPMMLSL